MLNESHFDELLDDFERQWSEGTRVLVEDFLTDAGILLDSTLDDGKLRELTVELCLLEFERRWKVATVRSETQSESPGAGIHPSAEEYLTRFPWMAGDSDVEQQFIDQRSRLEQQTILESSGASVSTAAGPTAGRFGDFELMTPFGAGGMGVVWKARNIELHRDVAIKLIIGPRPGASLSDRTLFEQRFQVEAQAAARLSHPGIVPVHSIGQIDGHLYYEMALIGGPSLRELLDGDGRPDQRTAARLVQQVAEAIYFAHRKGVIHRDLKPENILLDDKGQPAVADFGLAKLTDSSEQLTQAGAMFGTLEYMAPEQFADAGSVGIEADIYSLGVILYECLTGAPHSRPKTLCVFGTVFRTRTLFRLDVRIQMLPGIWKAYVSNASKRSRPDATPRPVNWLGIWTIS